jgi:hypothetical protein
MDDRFSKRGTQVALTFVSISRFAPGALAGMIKKSYAALVEECPEYWEAENENWEDFDREVFTYPESVGECAFISLLDGEPVGLASYDPRQAPQYGIVGQNCVLPEYQGKGNAGRPSDDERAPLFPAREEDVRVPGFPGVPPFRRRPGSPL